MTRAMLAMMMLFTVVLAGCDGSDGLDGLDASKLDKEVPSGSAPFSYVSLHDRLKHFTCQESSHEEVKTEYSRNRNKTIPLERPYMILTLKCFDNRNK